jgi:hypothetical protein
MGRCERLAYVYLKFQFSSVEYEPDGNTPPDFVCDNSIAVEVRRLNQNEFTSGERRGLEETSIPLVRGMKKLLASIERTHPSTSWFVNFNFRRPIPAWHSLRNPVNNALKLLDPEDPQNVSQIQIDRNFSLTVLKATSSYPSQFVFGGYIDYDSGGFIAAEVLRNAITCIEEKSAITSRYRHKYISWWLLLVDLTGLSPAQEERDLVRDNLGISHDWDRILVLHTQNPRNAWEI